MSSVLPSSTNASPAAAAETIVANGTVTVAMSVPHGSPVSGAAAPGGWREALRRPLADRGQDTLGQRAVRAGGRRGGLDHHAAALVPVVNDARVLHDAAARRDRALE